MKKTNALRILDTHKIDYEVHTYTYDEDHLAGKFVAEKTDLPTQEIYKTIVAIANTSEHLIFVIPILAELDLKKCARIAGVKRVELIHVKELLTLTGYMRGGCSPLGMKKTFRTFIADSCQHINNIVVSAGKRGMQVRLNPSALLAAVDGQVADLTRD